MVGVNLRGFFSVSRSALGAMLSRREGGGHLVNISTSLVDQPNAQVPCALASLTKGGLNAVTRELAIEYAAHGIRVNAVSLGVVRTPMNPRDARARRPPPARADGRGRRRRPGHPVSGAGLLRHWLDPACGRRPERRSLEAAAVAS